MSEPQGWIKLHRKTLENPLTKNPDGFMLWVQLLLRANHKDARIMVGNKFVDIKRGQLLTGRNKLVEYTGINRSKLERLLNLLESEHQIEQQKTTKYRLISITNYDKYQGDEQQTSNKRATNEQQLSTNKNEKNVDNDNNEKKTDIPDGINLDSWNEWVEYRKAKKKPISKLAATKQFNTLLKYSLEQQSEIIDKSISNDWAGLFDLKTKKADSSIPYELVAKAYNECYADKLGLSHVMGLTDNRKSAISAIWNFELLTREPLNTIGAWERYFTFCSESEGLIGGGGLSWVANFDTLINMDKYTKTIEGGFNANNNSN